MSWLDNFSERVRSIPPVSWLPPGKYGAREKKPNNRPILIYVKKGKLGVKIDNLKALYIHI